MTAPNPERLRELLAAALDRAQRASRPHHDNGATSLDATVEYVNSFAEVRAQHAALLHQIAERDAEVERLRPELDFMTAHYERQTAYTVNHRGALIYASSDMRDAYSEEHVRAEAAERARDEATGLLREAEPFIGWAGKPDGLMDRIAAFLAASGGK